MGDEPERRSPPALVTLPAPEQLGVSRPRGKSASTDWVDARRRLDVLGAVAFQVARTPEGGWRFNCLLPTDQQNYNHRIEADAGTEAEAVRLGLERAENWARQR
jgi:hypothetical protein